MVVESLPIRERVPLAAMTTLGVGGAARWFMTATTVDAVVDAAHWCHERQIPMWTLGGGSNLVVSDAGFPGLVLRIAIKGITFEATGEETRLSAGAGESWDDVVAAAVGRGFAGVECLSGIPGTVGGTPVQNVGAYGQEVAKTIESVTAFDSQRAAIVSIPNSDCEFTYRHSQFKSASPGRFIITGVNFLLREGSPAVRYPEVRASLEAAAIAAPTVADVRAAVLAIRRRKGMVVDEHDPDSRSVGSFFMNPIVSPAQRDQVARVAEEDVPSYPFVDPRRDVSSNEGPRRRGCSDPPDQSVKLPAAWLIERSGLHKGYTDGAVGISSKHPLAIINRGGATARDVIRLATHVKRTVADRFGIALRPEPIFVGFGEDPLVRYLVSEMTALGDNGSRR
ncbi:MAG TPA: UDP-N-acetylmuramate dehydrogenase [Vicinamibacterales bacterium]|jgi:UDP-N-acetylmuramate dehydrogenase|nr:UDP-N-acetylmuramate dehydrogenase [Vicinamibacterales bacterium]